MLHELVVRNLGVIEEASVVLGPGLTALTGETGAGKTLVTEAIQLLLGGKADTDLVRPGADEASVEGRFVGLDANGDETEWVVRRVVPTSGRSRAYVDGSFATIAQLEERVGALVEIHGQHGQQQMLRGVVRRAALDQFGGHDLVPLQETRQRLRDAQARLDELGGDEFARAREIELLQHQIGEIEAATIADKDEDERLKARELLLGDAEAHLGAAERSIQALSADGPAGAALAQSLADLDERAPFGAVVERLYAAQAELADIVDELRAQSAAIDDDPESLSQLQARRELFTDLRRKYGKDLAAVLAYHTQASERLDELERHSELAASVTEELRQLEEREAALAAALGDERRTTAPKIAKVVVRELKQLALPKARFDVEVEGVDGGDIDFAVAMNPGSPLLPMAKVASGGELSRIMLALQLVIGASAPTVIFDEIDAGVGGEAATSIGQALARVGGQHQGLVVTHLPQVAACADRQINIVKTASGKTTSTELHELEHEDRVVELARMLSGSPDSDSARAHAHELLQRDNVASLQSEAGGARAVNE